MEHEAIHEPKCHSFSFILSIQPSLSEIHTFKASFWKQSYSPRQGHTSCNYRSMASLESEPGWCLVRGEIVYDGKGCD